MRRGFTLIELLAVIVILAIIALIATPLILDVINSVKERTFNIEATNIEQAAEYYVTENSKIEEIPKYKEYYIPVSSLTNNIKKIKNVMLDEYVIVKKTDMGISYYYTGRDKNPYIKSNTLKETVESDPTYIMKNVKVNGVTVNKVIGAKAEKTDIKNWVWYSGQLWQVLETTEEYVKLVTANSVTSIAYGLDSEWNTSWVRKWLNEIDSESNQDGIFYNSLSRTDLLLAGDFCLDEPTNVTEEEYIIGELTRTQVTNFTPINSCENKTNDKIGLMTFEDYAYSLDGLDGIAGTLGNSYVDEDELTWLMTKYTGLEGNITDKTWHTYHKTPGHIEHEYYGTADYGKSVRPVIYMNSNTMIEEDNASNYGTINNPYRLVGEQKFTSGDNLNGVTIGSYIYLNEENNPNTTLVEYVTSRLNYNYNKTKARYRVIGIDDKGNIKVQRADVLRNLSTDIAMQSGTNIPYYYQENTCNAVVKVYTSCSNQNYFKPDYGNDDFNYNEGENIAYFLNNADNSYYNWLSLGVKVNILVTDWNLPVGAYGKDYVESLFNSSDTGEYPNGTNDGVVKTKIGLPTWGDMFSGNDINKNYWYINRWPNSYSNVANIDSTGDVYGDPASTSGYAARPVFYLKSSVKITGGEGTPTNPYTLSIDS